MKKLLALIITLVLAFSSFALFFAFADDTDEEFEGGGDLSRLIVPKTVYEYGEPINIKAIGSGKDWVGFYYPDDLYSAQWTYIDEKEDQGVGSGVEFDVLTAGFKGSSAPAGTYPIGEYIIRLQPNDSSNFNITIAWVKIKIVPPADAKIPEKPVSATYELENPTDGFAKGKLNVKLAENEITKNIVPFWGDENGNKLEGYTSLAKFKARSTDVSYEFPSNLMIPTGAKKLLVYTSNLFNQLSEECFVIELPENAAFKDPGKPIVEFQVVSDTHVVDQKEHTYNTNYVNMLNDIAKTSPDSMAMFVVGDMVDNGWTAEYKKFVNLYESVEGLPPYYLTLGNHDLFAGDLKEQINLFLKYANLPNGTHPKSSHYDFWLNGYHFVFLGNDNLVNMIDTTLNKETIEWLDKTLAEDRDENRPTFLFLHQGLANTVAGTIGEQGWDGVVDASVMRFKGVLRKYPEVIMFNGHSHWELDSERTMYPRTSALPTIFNTSAVAYLDTSYNIISGERLNGSEGYYIKVYEDKILVLGRDFTTGQWKPSAQFYVDYENGTGPKKNEVILDILGVGEKMDSLFVAPNGTVTPPEPAAVEGYEFDGWFTDKKCTVEFDPATVIDKNITLYAKWTKNEAVDVEPVTTQPAPTTGEPGDVDNNDGNATVIIIISCVAAGVIIAAAVVIVLVRKRKKVK